MKKMVFVFYQTLVGIFAGTLAAQTPLLHAHAHNDYVHKRPLYEALENGFTSIEIDVFLHNDELKVAHVPLGLGSKQTIEQLYLDPIKKVVEQNWGTIYKGHNTPVTFMIDFKTDGIATYQKLKEVLEKYKYIITVYHRDSVIHQRAINILISGSSPVSELLKEDSALATIDAALQGMGNNQSAKVITRYSSGWLSYFTWKGKGTMPPAQKQKLDSLVTQVHQMGKHIRFYHIPDKPNVWRQLLNAGVDWINTDKLVQFRRFYLEDYKR
ncbi:MAG TPA: phosphatidylinositol-specific phospholipase C/glycerophosphodiester phosphodiesterase family protein [Chitinophagales bacterium]|nr:phosphatidylinositol-specific phospholipase C/glycerophosphodiester phosphodiesterase family protein [Chitinophagales bacterium]